jgi:hypothetical protein
MSTLVTLDPGTRNAGVAIFAGDTLVAAASLTTNRADVALMVAEVLAALEGVDRQHAHLLSEYPRNLAARRRAIEDLDGLRAVVATVERLGWLDTRRVAPGSWKGQVPKKIHHARASKALNPWERDVWATLGPDGRDAVALGLWACRRLVGPLDRGGRSR